MALILVPTPVGNLDDMTPRAVEVLKSADLILCEDTRHSGAVLARWGVESRKMSYQKFNERSRMDEVLTLLKSGATVALISDAGTPAISDPGQLLVAEAVAAGLEVDCLPGATAFVPALVMSGFPTQPAVFLGFPPDKEGERLRWLAPWVDVPATLVLYLSPHKAVKQLAHLVSILGPRPACVAREISKKFGEVLRGTLFDLAQRAEWRGELVLVVAPPVAGAVVVPDWEPEALALRGQGQSVKDVTRAMEERYGVRANEVKKLLLAQNGR